MDKMRKTVPLLLLTGFLLAGCAQAPFEPTRAAVETSSAAPYDWREDLPAPSGELRPLPIDAELDPNEPLTRWETAGQIALPDGVNLHLNLSGVVGIDDSSVQQKLYGLQSVTVRENDTLLQTITFDAPYFQSEEGRLWSTAEDFGIAVADMNFDGLLDFSVKNNFTSEKVGAYCPFSFHFLWDAANRCFVPAPALDALPLPLFDAAAQTVVSTYSARKGDVWTIQTACENLYRYLDGTLQCVRKRELVLDTTQRLLTTRTAEWDGTVWVELPTETEPAYRERTRMVEVQTGVWVKLTAWGVRSYPQPDADNYRNGWLRQIDVFTADPVTPEAPPVQTIYCNSPMNAFYLDASDCFQASFPDYNFDGYPDLRFYSGYGTGGFFYSCYLWDAQSGRFVENKTLSDYADSTPNAETGEIESIGKMGYMGWVKTALRWQGDDLVPARENRYEYLFDEKNPKDETPPVRHTVSVYKDGGWVLLSEEILPFKDFNL